MELVSVIVPVYNVEKYLARCIQSVCGQSYQGLEIILVDDGSKDKSGVICDEYAERDGRIKVIHKENGGRCAPRCRRGGPHPGARCCPAGPGACPHPSPGPATPAYRRWCPAAASCSCRKGPAYGRSIPGSPGGAGRCDPAMRPGCGCRACVPSASAAGGG